MRVSELICDHFRNAYLANIEARLYIYLGRLPLLRKSQCQKRGNRTGKMLEKTADQCTELLVGLNQNQNIRIANEQFKNLATFKYLGTKQTNHNYIHDEIKSRLNSGNACYHSVQNLLSSRLI